MRHIILVILILAVGLAALLAYGIGCWRTPFSDAAEYVALGRGLGVDGVYHDHITPGKLRKLIAKTRKQDEEVTDDA